MDSKISACNGLKSVINRQGELESFGFSLKNRVTDLEGRLSNSTEELACKNILVEDTLKVKKADESDRDALLIVNSTENLDILVGKVNKGVNVNGQLKAKEIIPEKIIVRQDGTKSFYAMYQQDDLARSQLKNIIFTKNSAVLIPGNSLRYTADFDGYFTSQSNDYLDHKSNVSFYVDSKLYSFGKGVDCIICSDDDGKSWYSIDQGPVDSEIIDAVQYQSAIYVLSFQNSVYRCSQNFSKIEEVAGPWFIDGALTTYNKLLVDESYLYICTDTGIYRTSGTEDLETFENVEKVLPLDLAAQRNCEIALFKNTFVFTKPSVSLDWSVSNGANSWSTYEFSDDLETFKANYIVDRFSCFCVTDEIVYAGSLEGNIYYSKDGVTWNAIRLNLQNRVEKIYEKDKKLYLIVYVKDRNCCTVYSVSAERELQLLDDDAVTDVSTWSSRKLASLQTFSTEEQAIGTWIDGKAIYRKTWEMTAEDLLGGSLLRLPHIPIETVINSRVVYKALVGDSALVQYHCSLQNIVSLSDAETVIQTFDIPEPSATSRIFATLEYTRLDAPGEMH